MCFAELDRPAAGRHASPPHVLAERGQGQLLGDLRLADECAAAVPPLEVPVADEVVERRPERQTGDAELPAEPTLRGDRLADLELVDQLEDSLSGQDLFAHGAPYGSTGVRTWSRPLTRNQRRIH